MRRVFDQAFTDFMFPVPAGVRQDQMSAARREPGSDADGREEPSNRNAVPFHLHVEADDVDVVPEGRDGPIAPLETADSDLEEAARLARSSYSPLEADGGCARADARRERVARCRAIPRAPPGSGPVAPLAAGPARDGASTFDAR